MTVVQLLHLYRLFTMLVRHGNWVFQKRHQALRVNDLRGKVRVQTEWWLENRFRCSKSCDSGCGAALVLVLPQ